MYTYYVSSLCSKCCSKLCKTTYLPDMKLVISNLPQGFNGLFRTWISTRIDFSDSPLEAHCCMSLLTALSNAHFWIRLRTFCCYVASRFLMSWLVIRNSRISREKNRWLRPINQKKDYESQVWSPADFIVRIASATQRCKMFRIVFAPAGWFLSLVLEQLIFFWLYSWPTFLHGTTRFGAFCELPNST